MFFLVIAIIKDMKKSKALAVAITLSLITVGSSCTSSTPSEVSQPNLNTNNTENTPVIIEDGTTSETNVINSNANLNINDNDTSQPTDDITIETTSDDFILTDIDPSEVYYSGDESESMITGDIELASIEHVRGSGGITILEYGDTECPYTKDFQPTMEQILEKYDGQVRWGYKHFPLNQHTRAPFEAEATECAGDQGKFWEYIDRLFAITPANNELNPQELMTIAETVGLDLDQFDQCLREAKYKSTVQADSAEIQALGGNSTPFSLVLDDQGHIIDTIAGALPVDYVEETLNQHL